jgi:RNA polymerase sigma-70 factor (ECF subfamily)
MPDDEVGATLIEQVAALSAYARRLAGSAADADDLLQDTMLRCWSARASFTPRTDPTAWGRTIMRNRFLTNRRRARFQADLPESAIDLLLSVAENQENVVGLRDVGWALTELVPEQREAVLLAGEGVSTLDAADRLGIPGETFKSRMARGRTRLWLLNDGQGTHCSQIARRPFAPALSSPDPNAIG